MRGSVPRWDYGRVAEGERVGPLDEEWDGNEDEEPWPDVVPFQGPAGEASLTGWLAMRGQPLGQIFDPVPPMPQVGGVGVVPLPPFFDPVFLAPHPEFQLVPHLIGGVDRGNPFAPIPITLPAAYPRPRRFYRVQHSAAIDEQGIQTCPPSRTRDSAVLGLTAATIFPPSFERRINKTNLERALDPMNV